MVCRRMKSWAHQISVARASARDIAMHGSRYGVMFDKVSVGGRLERGEGFRLRRLRSRVGTWFATGPSLNFMLVSEDRVLLFMLAAVDGKSLRRLPAPNSAFAAVQVARDLFPRLQSFLRGVPLRHPQTPAQRLYQRLCPGVRISCLPVKRLLDDFPSTWHFEQREQVGHTDARAC